MNNKEAIYDEKIAPLVNEILALCKEHEIPMFVTFQYSDADFCTSAMEHSGHPIIKHCRALMRCAEDSGINIDKYVFWVMKELQGRPHSSIVLHTMGMPTNPCNY